MPVYLLNEELLFPSPTGATEEGLVAVGGDASPERLLLAYREGIFPWPMAGLPLLWFSPDPRFVLYPGAVHVPRSLEKRIRRGEYEVRADTAFERVIGGCASAYRPGQGGTWITDELRAGFLSLHASGHAHSIETWRDGELVGGLYGISLGAAFFGESMFANAPDASKVAFVTLLGHAFGPWRFHFVDCQVHTAHLERFGAREVARTTFLDGLDAALREPTRQGPFDLELTPREAIAQLG